MVDYTFPVLFDGARVTSGIGPRNSPTAGASSWHRGIDIAAPGGSGVVAPTDLSIIFAGQKSGYGNVVYGRDAGGNVYRFGHLNSIGVGVGDNIAQGGGLGTVGMTGTATGNHLHFEVRDAAGNLLADATRAVIAGGKKVAGNPDDCGWNPICHAGNGLKDAYDSIVGNVMPDGSIKIKDGLGLDGCGPLDFVCKLKKWLDVTGIVERSALYFVGLIFIIGGITFLAMGYTPKGAVKALAKGALA